LEVEILGLSAIRSSIIPKAKVQRGDSWITGV